jgi:two-component sensor histidine kinase
MAAHKPLNPEAALNLALAVIASSAAPVLLLDDDLTVVAASVSFFRIFEIDAATTPDRALFSLGAGEWDVPKLRSLLKATLSGKANIDAYEMDLVRKGRPDRHLVLTARKLDYADAENVRLVLAVSDVTDARASEKLKDDLLREKAILLQEIQHRVANSLQIIASVLLQSARGVQSKETRTHLHDAHSRVMSVAAVQRQLATSKLGDVDLRTYLTDLCDSLSASMIRDHKQLTLQVSSDDSLISPDISVSLGLIVTELVINALKHAFPGRRKGAIRVNYKANGAKWTLSVGDNGIGMPPDSECAKPGLGTGIVEALAKQLKASVEIANANPGTAVSIVSA